MEHDEELRRKVAVFTNSTLHSDTSPPCQNPGPRIAALTSWYECYYDVWLGGHCFRTIAKMHQKYGPIVRISPNEVHFNDLDFIDSLYPGAGERKTNRPVMVGKQSGTPDYMTATEDHDMHRRRRAVINPFFSVASVRKLEPVIRQHTEKVLARLEQATEPVEMNLLFKAYANDTVVQYAFGVCFHFLDDAECGKPYFKAVDMFFSLNHLFGHWPFIGWMVGKAPGWVMRNFGEGLREMWRRKWYWWIQKVGEIRTSNDPERVKSTIFGGVLNSSLPDAENTDLRLASETQLVIFAGEGTTANPKISSTHPSILATVKAKLSSLPDSPSFAQIDALPYFNAVIQETIRLHPGVSVVYGEYVIPAGVTYGMTPTILHKTASVFKNPEEFRPERWIENPKLSRAFMGFSRGPRGCIAVNLARREISVLLAALLVKYDVYEEGGGKMGPTLQVFDTAKERDIDTNSEYIIPAVARGSKGLRMVARR
ncbi:cytochrome P450 [Cucurbitaria berberidis CBS 394.84]|uniref:Cytochrome P450 n=1 Tax=Cucurbitaria berberidis CBS 394.84 TaxID=1168544 RepID=A0A9P4GBV4_9PLEO|nr:cytochrome P450 [Cucurbitaria berberidis CBS 394.84]KAF1842730.1 cytochrome P450 [Cucurbitaria berberidis CBS 394.84]